MTGVALATGSDEFDDDAVDVVDELLSLENPADSDVNTLVAAAFALSVILCSSFSCFALATEAVAAALAFALS